MHDLIVPETDLKHPRSIFKRFYHTYNSKRIMKSINYNSPLKFVELRNKNLIEVRKIKGKNQFFLKEESP